MATSILFGSLSGAYDKVIKTVYFKAVLCFFAMYTYLAIMSIPLLILFVYQLIISFVLKVFYQGKIQLAGGLTALFESYDTPGNVFNITYYIFIDGHCDIEKLRERISTKILAKDENGKRPYDLLLKSTTEKLGFTCLSDKSETIDFKNHVRLCPGLEDIVYTENAFIDAVSKLAECQWEETKPKWEFLIAPKVKKEGSEEISSGIAVKFHHLYMDGISLTQFLRNCVFDQPVPKLILDPVNPPIQPVSFFNRILLYFQVFFMGPYISLRLLGNDLDPVMTEGPLAGGKLFGRIKMKIPIEMMRRIRKVHNCSTSAILHSAFVGSFQKMAKRKGIALPLEIVAGVVLAKYPYPDEYPRNNLIFVFEPLVTRTFSDPIMRLNEIDKSITTVQNRTYAFKASELLVSLLGMYPASMLRAIAKSYAMSYYVSNVPGFEKCVRFDGNEVPLLYGNGALLNTVRYHSAVSFYGGSFCVGLYIEASKIIGNRAEMEEWVEEYENEIRFLDQTPNSA